MSMLPTYQANTGGQGGAPLSAPTGNWFLDGVNATLGTVAGAVGIWNDLESTRTANEVAKLNAKSVNAIATSPSPRNPIFDLENMRLEKVMFGVGIAMISFAVVATLVARKR